MCLTSTSARRRLAGLLAMLLLLSGPALAKKKKKPEDGQVDSSGIKGRVYAADGKESLSGVVVRAVDLTSGREFRSEPTDGKGRFEISRMPHGYYDLGFEGPDGLFVGNQVLNVPPGGFGVIRVRMGIRAIEVPGSTFAQEDRAGVAALERRQNAREFWTSPKGIAIIAAIGGGALLALAVSSEEDDASQFTVN